MLILATNWIDVADSAVKIGLGALIAGIVSVLVPIIAFAKETFSDRRARRLKLIEESIFLFTGYYSREQSYSAALTDKKMRFLRKIPDEFVNKRYEKARELIDETGGKLIQLISNLELLGHHSLADKIRAFATTIDAGQEKIRLSESVEKADANYTALKTHTKTLATDIHKCFGQIYKLEPELDHMLYSRGPEI